MKKIHLVTFLLTGVAFSSCETAQEVLTMEVTNPSAFDRVEVQEIDRSAVSPFLGDRPESDLFLREKGSETFEVLQWVDLDADGQSDQLLFQAKLAPKATKAYELILLDDAKQPVSELTTFSRFVPERTDDYTWENDKIAFRTYGPKGQENALKGVAGSTLSSGIDLWLKRTDKPVIDKWYAGHVKNPGFYHTDHGEGYDPYHVGGSRGTGGTGLWLEDSLQVSQNYLAYRTLATGPLRTVFELDYAPWGSYEIAETKRISLDLGSNFSKFEIKLSAAQPIQNYAAGITLHNNQGTYKIDQEKGWLLHWEAIDGAMVGEALVLKPDVLDSAFARVSEFPDQSHLLAVTKADNQLTYYGGFAWEKSGQVATMEDWEAMVSRKAAAVANPLIVAFKEL